MRAQHINLDDAWDEEVLGLRMFDLRAWGPRLRFAAPRPAMEDFATEVLPQLAPFVVYGSGDFHHLSALWLRRVREPMVVVSFDNHPDWDMRPPHWCCGGWVNRALELPQVEKVSVWGCGNHEVWWPGQVFGNRRAEREGRLEVHAWADARPAQKRHRRGAILRASWREDFARFAEGLRGGRVYVTIDLDCLVAQEAVTNWENGRFTTDELGWALGRLRECTTIVGGDLCGAFSPERYARRAQWFIARFDHPRLPRREAKEARAINRQTIEKLWPALTGNGAFASN